MNRLSDFPPGMTTLPEEKCGVCGSGGNCECLACPVCGVFGDPDCYEDYRLLGYERAVYNGHGMTLGEGRAEILARGFYYQDPEGIRRRIFLRYTEFGWSFVDRWAPGGEVAFQDFTEYKVTFSPWIAGVLKCAIEEIAKIHQGYKGIEFSSDTSDRGVI